MTAMSLRSAAASLALGLAALPGARGLVSAPAEERPWFFHGSRKEVQEDTATRTEDLRVHVTSIGAVGTTGFMEELKQMKPTILTNDPIDSDQIKHVPYSRLILSANFKRAKPQKIVYLYDDPTRAVLSVERRGSFMIQARKTRSDPFPHPFPKKLDEYVADYEEDFFQFEKHFDSFYEQCTIPVVFLKISEKTDHIKELAEFLETNVTEVRRVLVPWKPVKMFDASQESRSTRSQAGLAVDVVPLDFNPDAMPNNITYSNVPQWVKDKVKRKLSGLIKKYEALPGFKAIIPGKDCTK